MIGFNIYLDRWQRGAGSGALSDPETMHMCCLGFACLQNVPGLKQGDINDIELPAGAARSFGYKAFPEWLVDTSLSYWPENSRLAEAAYVINDSTEIKDSVRMFMLYHLFASHGVMVSFFLKEGDRTKIPVHMGPGYIELSVQAKHT